MANIKETSKLRVLALYEGNSSGQQRGKGFHFNDVIMWLTIKLHHVALDSKQDLKVLIKIMRGVFIHKHFSAVIALIDVFEFLSDVWRNFETVWCFNNVKTFGEGIEHGR